MKIDRKMQVVDFEGLVGKTIAKAVHFGAAARVGVVFADGSCCALEAVSDRDGTGVYLMDGAMDDRLFRALELSCGTATQEVRRS